MVTNWETRLVREPNDFQALPKFISNKQCTKVKTSEVRTVPENVLQSRLNVIKDQNRLTDSNKVYFQDEKYEVFQVNTSSVGGVEISWCTPIEGCVGEQQKSAK